jgi:hypothetical protein
MKNPTGEILAQASALRKAGKTNREIMDLTDLSHSQMERHFLAQDIKAGIVPGGFLAQPETNTAKSAMVAKLRAEGESWGLISVRFQEPESRTRKAFTEGTGLDSKGLRIGQGGRYVMDDHRFYTGGDRATLGKELDPNTPKLAQVPDPATEEKRTLARKAKALAKKAEKEAANATA